MDPMGMNHNSPRGSPRPFEFFGIPFESQAGREQIAEMVKEGGSVLTEGDVGFRKRPQYEDP